MSWFWKSLYDSAATFWGALWALVLGTQEFGRASLRSAALAALFGGASSSCSYAAVAAVFCPFMYGNDMELGAAATPVRLSEVEHGSPDYGRLVALRDEILRRPLGLAFSAEQLDSEREAHHVACFLGEEIVGCLVLTPQENGRVRMRQVAVREAVQGRGIGRALVKYAEALGRRLGCREMVLHARETAVGFYERLGYVKAGERFFEVTLPHWEMTKRLG